MATHGLGAVEAQFADLIWENEPIGSGELVKLCNRELNWKKPTTYTVLRKLCERGIFQNKDSVVTSLISKEDFEGMQCESFVDETFDGALPAFVAAFTKRRKLTPSEIEELRSIIDSCEE
ncbi:MAG: BlaI/MecI/CopY family transcriptional regulator [Lachnospiraceae bacterium]|nr:BlaI/MecI/CopY family transcriptional regulator [Lachnospiraceae bacterium]